MNGAGYVLIASATMNSPKHRGRVRISAHWHGDDLGTRLDRLCGHLALI